MALRLAMAAEIVAASIISGVLTMAWNGPLQIPQPWFDIYERIPPASGILSLLVLLALLFWIYRANKNASALSDLPLEYSPGWAVGWFFVPIAGWFKPYQVMLEIYKASRTPANWHKTKSASIVGCWWALRLTGTLAALALKFGRPQGQLLIRLSLVAVGPTCASLILLWFIVARINKWQAGAHRSGGVEDIF